MRSFEKNIKNKASDFQLEPLPDSFDKVMLALEEKKKKRRFIFWLWFLIPGLALGFTGTYAVLFYPAGHSQDIAGSSVSSKQVIQSDQKLSSIGANQAHTAILYNVNEPVNSKSYPKTENIKTQPVQDQRSNISARSDSKNSSLPFHQKQPVISSTTNAEIPTTKKREEINLMNVYNNDFSLLNSHPPLLNPQFNIMPFPHRILSPVRSGFSRWSLGMYCHLGVSKSIFINNKDSTTIDYTNSRTAGDQFVFSYSAGIQVRYSPVKFLAIETGIGFTHYESIQFITDAGVTSGSVDPNNNLDTVFTAVNSTPGSQEYRNVYDYISIPLKLYYQQKWKWIGVEAGGGIIFDIPVNTSSYTADENTGTSYYKNTVKDSRLNMFGIQASANVNVVFHVKKISFFAGPVFKYRLNSMYDKNYIIQQQNYFIGAETGIRYNF